MSSDERMSTQPWSHWQQVPDEIRRGFWEWFDEVHDEEEEMYAPGTPPCDDRMGCCEKIGEERLEELFQQFLADQPAWVRQLAYVQEDLTD